MPEGIHYGAVTVEKLLGLGAIITYTRNSVYISFGSREAFCTYTGAATAATLSAATVSAAICLMTKNEHLTPSDDLANF